VTPVIRNEATTWLQEQPWPGNVRQLENVIRQALVQARPLAIGLDHVRRAVAPLRAPPNGAGSQSAYIADLLERARAGNLTHAHAQMISEMEAELFEQAIRLAGGNQAQVARWLGVTRLKVREKLRELGLQRISEGNQR
jgi:DNA-binding NtrC family response regulator